MAYDGHRAICSGCGDEYATFTNEYGRFIKSHKPKHPDDPNGRWCWGSGCKPCDCGGCNQRDTIHAVAGHDPKHCSRCSRGG